MKFSRGESAISSTDLKPTKSHSVIKSCKEYSSGKEQFFKGSPVSRNLHNELPEEPLKSDPASNEYKRKFSGIDEVSRSFGSRSSEIRQSDSETTSEARIKTDCTKAHDQHDFVNSYDRNWSSSAITNIEDMAVNDVISEKTVVATVENGSNSGIQGPGAKRRRKRKMDYVKPQTIRQYFGMPLGDASKSLGVSRSTMKRVCRELSIPRWPFPQRNKKHGPFGISFSVLLLIGFKRWRCSSSRHGFSGRWWICRKYNALAFKSNPSDDFSKGKTICEPPVFSLSLKESDDCIIETAIPFSKPHQTRLGIYEAARLILGLKRWRKRSVPTHSRLCNDGQISDIIKIVDVSPKKNVVNYSDTPKVTVKATYKDDIVKFKFPFSSGLLKLKDQVAQRIKLQSNRFHLKYRDEDDDLILLACDDDLCNLMPSVTSASDTTIRLIVKIVDD